MGVPKFLFLPKKNRVFGTKLTFLVIFFICRIGLKGELFFIKFDEFFFIKFDEFFFYKSGYSSLQDLIYPRPTQKIGYLA